MSINATYYERPHGKKRFMTITRIHPEDELWFKAHGAKLSTEELTTGDIVVYADIGMRTQEGEEVEAIEISGTRDSYETLTALRKQCEQMLTSWPNKVVTMNGGV